MTSTMKIIWLVNVISWSASFVSLSYLLFYNEQWLVWSSRDSRLEAFYVWSHLFNTHTHTLVSRKTLLKHLTLFLRCCFLRCKLNRTNISYVLLCIKLYLTLLYTTPALTITFFGVRLFLMMLPNLPTSKRSYYLHLSLRLI